MFMSAGGDAGWGRFGAGVLAPLPRYPHFVRLPDGTAGDGTSMCRPAFRPHPAGYPGRLIQFGAADCLRQSTPSLLINHRACC
jgi:hypothetical protein